MTKVVIALALALMLLTPVAARAQSTPALTLDEAIALALQRNRIVENADLVEGRSEYELATARSRRLPVISTEAQIARLLHPIDVSFPAGAFGTFPSTGPVPAVDTSVTTPVTTNVLFNASVSQPLTGLFQANLGIRQSEAARELAREDGRAARLGIVRQVRHTYYAILQATSGLEAADVSDRLLKELARVVQTRVSQQVVLKTEALEVDARLAQNDATRITLRHAIASAKEELNQLLGRDLSTDFDVVPLTEVVSLGLDRETTGTNRPDVRQAQLRVQQAEIGIRQANVDRFPDVNLTVQMVAPMNIDGAPSNIASFGIQAKWEPFDWGRRSRAIAIKRLDAQRAARALSETESTARLEINRSRRALEEAQAKLRVAVLSQGAAREQARVRTTQYQERAALFSDVLYAQSSFAESTHQYETALLSVLTAQANLELALGEDIVP